MRVGRFGNSQNRRILIKKDEYNGTHIAGLANLRAVRKARSRKLRTKRVSSARSVCEYRRIGRGKRDGGTSKERENDTKERRKKERERRTMQRSKKEERNGRDDQNWW